MTLRRTAFISILLPLAGACGSFNEPPPGDVDVVSSEIPAEVVRVCDIRARPDKYLDVVVRVRGIYKSDHLYYSYLVDDRCDSNKTVEVDHPLNTNGDKSVHDFFSAEDERCENEGGSVCPISWPVIADVLIKKQSSQRLLAEFKHVEDFKK